MRVALLLVVAIVSVIAGIAALQLSSQKVNTTQAPTASAPVVQNVSTVEVLVAKTPIAVGTTIDDTMVDRQPWPSNLVLDGFIVDGSRDANIMGKIARAPLQAREPFISSKLANPNDPSFLAAALPSGKRAVTFATDAVAGVAGYVFPGDNIDVLLTHNLPQDIKTNSGEDAKRVQKPAFTEVLASNVRVLAVNVRDPKNADSATAAATPSSMTIEVTEDQAQQLRLGEKVGTLSVTLRSLKDRDNSALPDPTGMDALSRVQLVRTGGVPVTIIRGVSKDTDAPMNGFFSKLFNISQGNSRTEE